VIIDAPVLVTVDAPRTAKPCAAPSGDWADAEEAVRRSAARRTIVERWTVRRRDEHSSIMRARLPRIELELMCY
jgi:hypothetical protein